MWAFPVLGCTLLASALLLRRWPLAALAVMLGGAVAAMALGPGPGQTPPLLIVLAAAAGTEIGYIAATRPRRVSAAALAMVGAGLLIPGPAGPDLAPYRAGAAVVVIIAWLIGHSIRQAQAQAELQRAQAAAQIVLAERLRIARELHDMVAHSIGIIAIQAGAGHRVFDTRPEQARDALAAIEATSRETLSGLRRRLLGRPAPRRRLPRRRPATPARAGPMTIQVILADDQPLVRAGLRMLIEQTPDIDVAGEAGTGAEAVKLARDTAPDVVVMDIRMPGMDGIEATQLITVGDPRARVLVLTTFDDDDYVYGALRAGASGFLVKDMALEDILTAIRVVAAGDAMIAPGVTRRLIGQFASELPPGRKPRQLTGITDREREVLRLVGLGMSNAEIAAALYITAGTAKTHVARLLAKLGARDRVQLVITAYEAGLVSASR